MWNYLKQTDKPIVLYGMGNGADKIIKVLDNLGIKLSGVFASDDFVRGQLFHGFEVMTYSSAKHRFGDMIVLVSFGTQRPEILQRIRDIAAQQELYAPDVPVVGSGLFDKAYAAEHKNELQSVYNMLADDASRKVFENIVNYRISGKTDYLFDCESKPQEAYKNILHLDNDEIYMDLGAYTGDTINEFLQYVNSYNQIYAVEPDVKNFKRLIKNTNELENIECINVGIHCCKEQLAFDMNAGRNSGLAKTGKLIQMDNVDNILSGKPVTYIKMDVEGQEAKAIEGAKNTIVNYKPKMLISCYHRTEDIFDLPLRIAAMRSDYKLYMRHFPYVPAWDTNYYFV